MTPPEAPGRRVGERSEAAERTAAEWMQLHVETLFTRDAHGDLLRVNEEGGKAAPRFLLGHTRDGNACWFGPDLDDELRYRLTNHPAVLAPVSNEGPNPRQDELVELLAEYDAVERCWSGPTYRFPDSMPSPSGCVLVTVDNASVLAPRFHEWLGDVGECEPFAVALYGDSAASICVSVRISDRAHEAGVETHPDYRGLGLASRAAAFWAAAVRAGGSEPLYSTSWSNQASQGVARSLGLIRFGHTFHVT